jgi:hypothetical protein
MRWVFAAMADASSRTRRLSAALALCVAVMGAASMTYYHVGLFIPLAQKTTAARGLGGRYSFSNDFYPVWLTSREWKRERRDPYSTAMTREIQTGLFGRPLDPQRSGDPLPEYRTFAYPAFTDLLLWPAAEIPFAVSRVLLAPLLAVLTLVSVVFWARALSWRPTAIVLAIILLLTLSSYPVLEGLYAGQLGLLVGFLLAASLLALQRGRLLFAGFLMALTTIKPQMTVLVVFFLVLWTLQNWRVRRAFCVGLFGTLILLVGAALLVWPRWIHDWLQVLLGYHRYANPPLVAEVLAQPLRSGAAVTWLLMVLLLAGAVLLAWRNRAAAAGSRDFWLTLGLLLAITTIALLPGQAVHDHVLLLPALFLFAQRRQEMRGWIASALLAIGIGVLLWPWFASLALILVRPLLTHDQFYSKAVFALPLRTAAVFPFVVLGLLVVCRRSAAVAELPLSPD